MDCTCPKARMTRLQRGPPRKTRLQPWKTRRDEFVHGIVMILWNQIADMYMYYIYYVYMYTIWKNWVVWSVEVVSLVCWRTSSHQKKNLQVVWNNALMIREPAGFPAIKTYKNQGCLQFTPSSPRNSSWHGVAIGQRASDQKQVKS